MEGMHQSGSLSQARRAQHASYIGGLRLDCTNICRIFHATGRPTSVLRCYRARVFAVEDHERHYMDDKQKGHTRVESKRLGPIKPLLTTAVAAGMGGTLSGTADGGAGP